ncbi:hypothetical protein OBBRIDRAFT_836347 [Obba rivulosa]|uniref:Uncharacterized protein n=1 Tax=Obba rivulosa TaxID=1052685 RepID=A0A8E2DIZ3_9APHY|nr:hypothetical protein OBBRIDRAFT_836347 [Obba rivulosa]
MGWEDGDDAKERRVEENEEYAGVDYKTWIMPACMAMPATHWPIALVPIRQPRTGDLPSPTASQRAHHWLSYGPAPFSPRILHAPPRHLSPPSAVAAHSPAATGELPGASCGVPPHPPILLHFASRPPASRPMPALARYAVTLQDTSSAAARARFAVNRALFRAMPRTYHPPRPGIARRTFNNLGHREQEQASRHRTSPSVPAQCCQRWHPPNQSLYLPRFTSVPASDRPAQFGAPLPAILLVVTPNGQPVPGCRPHPAHSRCTPPSAWPGAPWRSPNPARPSSYHTPRPSPDLLSHPPLPAADLRALSRCDCIAPGLAGSASGPAYLISPRYQVSGHVPSIANEDNIDTPNSTLLPYERCTDAHFQMFLSPSSQVPSSYLANNSRRFITPHLRNVIHPAPSGAGRSHGCAIRVPAPPSYPAGSARVLLHVLPRGTACTRG